MGLSHAFLNGNFKKTLKRFANCSREPLDQRSVAHPTSLIPPAPSSPGVQTFLSCSSGAWRRRCGLCRTGRPKSTRGVRPPAGPRDSGLPEEAPRTRTTVNKEMPSPGGGGLRDGEGTADRIRWGSGCGSPMEEDQGRCWARQLSFYAFARRRACASGLNLLMNQSARVLATVTRSSAFLGFRPSFNPCAI
jgi:hypothetical protein